jgi:Domain of unknown function (DUF4129)
MAVSFEKTSWRWQLEQLQQQLGEWIEVKFRSDDLFPAWLASLLVRLTWFAVAGLAIWVGYKIIYPYWRKWLLANNRSNVDVDLSIEKIYTVTELLEKSQQFQRDRDYTQASRWLYLAMLQRLNDADLIPHRVSRTDREYLKLLETAPTVEIGKVLVSTHEQLYFGDLPITLEGFDRCQQAYRQIEERIGATVRK